MQLHLISFQTYQLKTKHTPASPTQQQLHCFVISATHSQAVFWMMTGLGSHLNHNELLNLYDQMSRDTCFGSCK